MVVPVASYLYAPPYDSLSIGLSSDRIAVIVFAVAGAVVGATVGILIDELARLANEQSALRRVATLVARAAPPDELFTAVTAEAGRLLAVDTSTMYRVSADGALGARSSGGRCSRSRSRCSACSR